MLNISHQEDVEKCLEPLRRLIVERQDDSEAYYKLALAMVFLEEETFTEGLKKAAVEPLNEAIRLKPNYVEAYRLLGKILADLELYSDATPVLRKAIRLNPDDAVPYSYLMLAIEDLAEFDPEFQREYQRALDKVRLLTWTSADAEQWDEYESTVQLWGKYSSEISEEGVKCLLDVNENFKSLIADSSVKQDNEPESVPEEKPVDAQVVETQAPVVKVIEPDFNNVPKKLKGLVPVVMEWGFAETGAYGDLLRSSSKKQKNDFTKKVSKQVKDIKNWLKEYNGGTLPREAEIFRNLLDVYEEIKK